ncbi:hypothetical protein [Thermogemmatispora carboxidivorans]|uniref:hypothetical protein n=1 Tax=Thermogemmatispora carboxidivorans TaxID=1382306 RepID=UPI001EE2D5AC|nr:hypothetical protein [Thermogemmatispora carboxidivorans]
MVARCPHRYKVTQTQLSLLIQSAQAVNVFFGYLRGAVVMVAAGGSKWCLELM